MRQVVLVRFVFKGNNAIQVVMSEQEARDWVARFKNGHLRGVCGDAAGWFSFDAAELAGVHWCLLPENQQGQQPWHGQTSWGYKPGQSGINN